MCRCNPGRLESGRGNPPPFLRGVVMTKRKRLILVVGAIALFMVCVCLVLPALLRPAPGVTTDNFAYLRPGTSFSAACERLGEPNDVRPFADDNSTPFAASWRDEESGREVNLTFDRAGAAVDGQLVSRREYV